MDPAPPPITIVNPNNPAGTADVLVSGPERWRPSRRQKVVVSLTVLAVALVAASATIGTSRVLGARADKAALKEVSLTLIGLHPGVIGGDGLLPITVDLASGGGHDLILTDVQVVGRDAHSGGLSTVLPKYGAIALVLPQGVRCAISALVKLPTAVQLTLRTYRGSRLERTLPLAHHAAMFYIQAERRRCGIPPPGETLSFGVGSSAVDGHTLVVDYVLTSTSTEELLVTSTRPSPALALAPFALPVRLPPTREGSSPPPGKTLVFHLRVADCSAFRATQESDATLQPYVDIVVKDPWEAETVRLDLDSFNGETQRTRVSALNTFRRWCGLPTLR